MSERENGHAGDMIAAALILATGTSAYADPITFENDANFDWLFNTLDLTLPADQQGGPVGGSSIYMNYFGDYYPTFSYQHTYSDQAGASVLAGGFGYNYAVPFEAGDVIDANIGFGQFEQFFTFEFTYVACDYKDPYDCYSGNRGLLPEGVQTYLGVSLTIDNATHYGWVGVERSGAFIDVFAWGYETEAGVGITVPSPAPLAVLAFGAGAGLLTRPKRKS